MKIYEFDQYPLSIRHGSYGGAAGDKDGIKIGDDYWIVKYPKNARYLNNVNDLSYVSSPLSEFLGSQIYKILGFDVHDTILGIRNDKLVQIALHKILFRMKRRVFCNRKQFTNHTG